MTVHSRTVVFSLPVARVRPVRENATDTTRPVWPARGRRGAAAGWTMIGAVGRGNGFGYAAGRYHHLSTEMTLLVNVTDALGRLVDLPARSGDGADPDSGRSHFPARFTENVAARAAGRRFP